ncbi:MAG: O-antigen polymerase [Lachnospiraceae bacterium]
MGIYLISYGASFLFARAGYDYLSGLALLLAAVYLYWYDYRSSGNLIHLRGIFSLFWVGGQGLACLKLSYLQRPWDFITWVCFFLAFSGFWLTFELCERYWGRERATYGRGPRYWNVERSLLLSMGVITCCGVAAFVVEAIYLGYIPLFLRGVPHAYSYFHVTGVHYITVSVVLVPALSVVYFLTQRSRRGSVWVWVMDAIAILIPILCVSRFQVILAVFLALFTYIAMERNVRLVYVLGVVAALIPVYVILSVARSHDVAYLNGIFEMKQENMPIFISQPYIYITNNYDNFDCLVRGLEKHSFGMRSLFPLWALTGLKFIVPSLVQYPIFINKTELTTLTLFYDAYYDFGITGVLVFSCLLGAVSYCLVRKIREMSNPVGCLFYAQMAMYLMLSFFTTWFSNPATWFYLVVTGLVYGFCSVRHR